MNRVFVYLLCGSLIATSSMGFASNDINQYKTDTESLWRSGQGAEDGAFSAISASMLGWGVGLAAAIAIIASVLHEGSSHHAHAHAHSSCP